MIGIEVFLLPAWPFFTVFYGHAGSPCLATSDLSINVSDLVAHSIYGQ
jgi:hypothetical protein